MIQDVYQKAIKFAGEKHHKQTVPDTKANYLLHLSNVAMEVLCAYEHNANFDIELAIQCALLHDTIEDTNTSYEEIKTVFGAAIAQGVLALTKDITLGDKKTQMLDSLTRIKKLPKEIAIVKLADRITNLQVPPSYWTIEKRKNYCTEAVLINETLANSNEYLNNRLATKIENYQKYLKA